MRAEVVRNELIGHTRGDDVCCEEKWKRDEWEEREREREGGREEELKRGKAGGGGDGDRE